jgi:SAM-dependent methyltransferase
MISIVDTRPSLDFPISQACTQNQFNNESFVYWCDHIKEKPRLHRKQWEFCYILQVLATHGMMAPARRGLGYGVGTEPLTAVFANAGCHITATDLALDEATEKGWVSTNEHSSNLEMLNTRGICDPIEFQKLVEFRCVDMNNIPSFLMDYDFTWSACCLEHLGSLKAGLDFIENSLTTLKPGGVAVHTTELNCSSDDETVEVGGTVLYRKRDIIGFCEKISSMGHQVELNLHLGDLPVDKHVDVPPYSSDNHLKLQIEKFVCTSYGIVIKKMA